MDLSKLKKIKGNDTKAKRRGRGIGSGKGGHTMGKGTKGQKSRQGNSIPYGFEGGQVPLYKKLPRMGGFNNPTRKQIKGVNIKDLNVFEADATVTPQDLLDKKIVSTLPKDGIKILGTGKIDKKLVLEGFLYSESAKQKLEKAGCTIKND